MMRDVVQGSFTLSEIEQEPEPNRSALPWRRLARIMQSKHSKSYRVIWTAVFVLLRNREVHCCGWRITQKMHFAPH
jgi:hypothetical protein